MAWPRWQVSLPFFFAIIALASTVIVLRIVTILKPRPPPSRTRRRHNDPHHPPSRLLVVLGSGGHTAEMLAMLDRVDLTPYRQRTWVISSGDRVSAQRARDFEDALAATLKTSACEKHETAEYDIRFVPRARRIHQSLFTTPASAINCLAACFDILRGPAKHESGQSPRRPQGYPDVILTNGPGTGVIVVLAALVLRFFNYRRANRDRAMRTIYVESWARVNRLSLSGRLLLHAADRFVVQWQQLQNVGKGKGEFLGVLV